MFLLILRQKFIEPPSTHHGVGIYRYIDLITIELYKPNVYNVLHSTNNIVRLCRLSICSGCTGVSVRLGSSTLSEDVHKQRPGRTYPDRAFVRKCGLLYVFPTLHAPDTDAREARAEKDDGGRLRHARYWPGSDPQR